MKSVFITSWWALLHEEVSAQEFAAFALQALTDSLSTTSRGSLGKEEAK